MQKNCSRSGLGFSESGFHTNLSYMLQNLFNLYRLYNVHCTYIQNIGIVEINYYVGYQ
jgi:hypothetical protein